MKCDTADVTVYFTATGQFGSKNVFTAQLGDSNFSNFTNAGSLKSTTSGSIVVHDVPERGNYRVRISSSNPYLVSKDNGTDIIIPDGPFAAFYIPPNILEGDVVTFNAGTGGLTNLSFAWDFGSGATPSTSTDQVVQVTYSTTGMKQISLTEVSSPLGCFSSGTQSLYVFGCNPAIPSNAVIDSTTLSSSDLHEATRAGRPIWVVPGGTLNIDTGCTVFAEPGTTIIGDGYANDTVYLKAGASFEGRSGCSLIIAEPGSSVQNACVLLKCGSLNFDYTNAPPYNISGADVGQKEQANSNIHLYPNPAFHLVTIESPEIPHAISVRNELGEEMLHDAGPIVTNRLEFDVSRFAQGIYYVSLSVGNDTKVLKFAVSR